ncbi:hypothetical protein LXL04_006390 [Taraxacum kok-saghyz]
MLISINMRPILSVVERRFKREQIIKTRTREQMSITDQISWRNSRKSLKRKDGDDDDDFYDAVDEPSADNNGNISDTTDPPPPPSSDTDSTVDGSQCDSYIPTPFYRLPSSAQTSPLSKSPWSSYTERPDPAATDTSDDYVGLMTSLVREEGHIYSLATSGDLLYTGSSSKNIRVWKSQKEYSGFKAHSGLVKSIVLSGDKIFTGHQDGKIRVWKALTRDPKVLRQWSGDGSAVVRCADGCRWCTDGGPMVVRWWRWSGGGLIVVRRWSDSGPMCRWVQVVHRRWSGGGPMVVRWWRWSESGPAVVRQWSDVPMGAIGAPTVVRRWSDGGPVVGAGGGPVVSKLND